MSVRISLILHQKSLVWDALHDCQKKILSQSRHKIKDEHDKYSKSFMCKIDFIILRVHDKFEKDTKMLYLLRQLYAASTRDCKHMNIW